SWICDRPGMTPRLVLSAAPTMATDLGFMATSSLASRGLKEGQRDLVRLLLKGNLERHVEHQGVGRLRAANNVGHHARPLGELDHGDGIGGREPRCRAMVDNVAVQLRLAGGLDHGHPARGALGAKRPGRKVSVAAVITALQAQLAGLRAFPKMPGLRRWNRQRSSSFGHEVLLITCCTPILRAIASANKTEYCGGYASSKSKVCNGEEMQATFAEC